MPHAYCMLRIIGRMDKICLTHMTYILGLSPSEAFALYMMERMRSNASPSYDRYNLTRCLHSLPFLSATLREVWMPRV